MCTHSHRPPVRWEPSSGVCECGCRSPIQTRVRKGALKEAPGAGLLQGSICLQGGRKPSWGGGRPSQPHPGEPAALPQEARWALDTQTCLGRGPQPMGPQRPMPEGPAHTPWAQGTQSWDAAPREPCLHQPREAPRLGLEHTHPEPPSQTVECMPGVGDSSNSAQDSFPGVRPQSFCLSSTQRPLLRGADGGGEGRTDFPTGSEMLLAWHRGRNRLLASRNRQCHLI